MREAVRASAGAAVAPVARRGTSPSAQVTRRDAGRCHGRDGADGEHVVLGWGEPRQGRRWTRLRKRERRNVRRLVIRLVEMPFTNHKQVVRTLRVFQVNHGPLPDLPRKSPIWSHTRVLLQIDSQTIKYGEVTSKETRYYVSSMSLAEMPPEQWLDATVLHWGVETCHQILDVSFEEDDRPW